MNPATANLTCAITKGCATSNAILVAVEAEAHKMANKIPATAHFNCLLMVSCFLGLKKEAKLNGYDEKERKILLWKTSQVSEKLTWCA